MPMESEVFCRNGCIAVNLTRMKKIRLVRVTSEFMDYRNNNNLLENSLLKTSKRLFF
ncbi:hypothetical protein GH741_04880 [Aquibacillus halophilus]|uniref:Uncharacterized protein n=1 Tax=Aquibacillus halophilus TaxID=930132 RepID=A0A6A8DDU6_9BACI|nr:hypothetical protein [Aquibacillus halophilus]MRH42009.1 hypothetical protein [Aquibacillus halophilus]